MQNSVNSDIGSSVNQVNTYTMQIADLNKQIARLTTGTGTASNDQLVSDLNNVVGVTVS